MSDYIPFLQIVHVSDLHTQDSSFRPPLRQYILMRALSAILPAPVYADIEAGLSGHDFNAVPLFRKFLRQITFDDPVWSKLKSWLICTGDLTTFGDKDSLTLALRYLSEFAKAGGLMSATIHGNHDTWPGRFPLFASPAEFASQRHILTSLGLCFQEKDVANLAAPIAPHEVHLYSFDTVIGGPWNTLAVGIADLGQFNRLEGLVANQVSTSLRIALSHHPVHYPRPRPAFWKSLLNDRDVGLALNGGSQTRSPLVSIVLSGHVHRLFPEHDSLAASPQASNHPDLGKDQCQLIVGTLMQFDHGRTRTRPHQCQVLRFYQSTKKPSEFLLERLFAARQSGSIVGTGVGLGDFQFIPGGTGSFTEEMRFLI